MDRSVSTTIVIALIALALLGMYLGWRARQKRQAALPRPLPVPAALGTAAFAGEVFYVATTVAGEPLNRIAIGGLGFRARALVEVHREGVVLAIPGQPDAWLPVGDIRAVERATWTIDRVVEKDGLVLLAWTLGESPVDSYLRVTPPADPNALVAAVTGILSTTSKGRK